MIEFHKHDGIDTPNIDPRDLRGFPSYPAIPTHKAQEGTPVFANFGGFVYLYVMLNKVWNLMAVSPAFSVGASLAVPDITIGGGTTVTSILSSTAVLNFGAISPESSADLTMALLGAIDGDSITIGVQNAIISSGTNCDNISFFAWVSAPDVITVRCVNNSAVNTANPASGTFRATVTQF